MSQQNKEEDLVDTEAVEAGEQSVETWTEILGIDEQLLQIEEQIISLFHQNISPDYMNIAAFHEKYVENDSFNVYVYTTSDQKVHSLSDSSTIPRNTEIAGVVTAGICTKDQLESAFEELKFSADQLVSDSPLEESDFPISIVKTLVVHPEYQDSGVGFQLVSSLAPMLRDHTPAITTIWAKESGNKHGKVETIAKKIGGRCIATYDRMWPDEWNCVECGKGNECVCGCTVYALGV